MSSWLSFLRPRNRFSLAELRYLTEQLQKVQYVNDDNKDSVIEVLRSIAELVTYGDQHDPSIFEFFMEKQIMGEFARILKISKLVNVALQLLQTISIMIQNLKNEHSIYYIFSNEHINYLITYSFDFQNEELLSYYISFLRAISGKLNKNTISLLVKTKNEEVVSFPLYVEAIRFAFHDENMVRIAVRALTLNVYHVGDEAVNKYVVCSPQSDYFSNIVTHFSKRCINLDDMVAQMSRYINSLFLSPTFDPSPKKLYLDCVTLNHLVQLANHLYALHKCLCDLYIIVSIYRKLDASVSSSSILDAVDDIEDNLYYFSDVISAGVPDLGRLLTDNILQLLVFPLLLPSLKEQNSGTQVSIATSLHLLCSILHIFKTKDLATTIASALFCPPEAFVTRSEATSNGCPPEKPVSQESSDLFPFRSASDVNIENSESSSFSTNKFSSHNENCYSHNTLRELLLSYIVGGNDSQVLGSLSLLTTLLQTKELDESVLDWLGILPQRRQHKKLLLEALVGEDAGEEQLFSSISMLRDNSGTELDRYLRKLKDEYGFYTKCEINPKIHRYQVLDALVSLFCRSNISAEILWLGGWLLRQLLPHGEEEFASFDLGRLKDSHKLCTCDIMEEIKGVWCDVLIPVLRDEWAMCKRALEASSPPKDSKSIFLPAQTFSSGGESSLAAAERMCEMVKVFVLQRQLLLFSFGGTLPDLPDIPDLHPLVDSSVISSPRTSVLDVLVPKPGSEISLANAVPCRIAFERGKERHFCFLAISRGISGWIILAQESPVRQQGGIVRVTAPLAGSDPKIDEKHPKWLHLRIRPSTMPFLDSSKLHFFSKGKTKNLVDGRWTLAFKDEDSCKAAESMLVKEINSQQHEVERRLKTLLQSNTLETPEPCIVDTTDD